MAKVLLIGQFYFKMRKVFNLHNQRYISMKTIFLFLLIFFVSIVGSNGISELILEAQSKVNTFYWLAIASVVSACLVAVMNIIATQFDNQKYKKISVAIALFNAILVILNETVISGDYQTLMHKKVRGDRLIGRIRQLKYDFDNEKNEELKNEHKEQIFKKIDEIGILREEYYDETVSYSGNVLKLPFISNAYAQGKQNKQDKKTIRRAPKWMDQIPQGHAKLYFVSYGVSENFSEAKRLSQANKVEMGSRVLTASLISSVEFGHIPGLFNLLQATISSSKAEDVYFHLNEKIKKYEYFTLYSTLKSTLQTKIDISREISKTPNFKGLNASAINENTWNGIAEAEAGAFMKNLRNGADRPGHTFSRRVSGRANATSMAFSAIDSGGVKEAKAMNKVMERNRGVTGPTFFNLLYGKFLIHRGRECSSIKKYLKEKQIEAYFSSPCVASK